MLSAGLASKTFSFLRQSYGTTTTTYADTGLVVTTLPNTTYFLDCTMRVEDTGDGLDFKLVSSNALDAYYLTYDYDGVNQGDMAINSTCTLAASSSVTVVHIWGCVRTVSATVLNLQAKKLTDLFDPTQLSTGAYLRLVKE